MRIYLKNQNHIQKIYEVVINCEFYTTLHKYSHFASMLSSRQDTFDKFRLWLRVLFQ